MARQYGDPTDSHFINDYSIEYNLDKCKGIVEYVKYIERKGAKVGGIGTQMHIDINNNIDNIAEHFKLLAATGKLIKYQISPLGWVACLLKMLHLHNIRPRQKDICL